MSEETKVPGTQAGETEAAPPGRDGRGIAAGRRA